ncbi:MAG: hypothetical protein KatS3mg082_3256 [Nitrospiraceae bacterium]|nr:MAG: hypothetical protein KatS3mg082_3256 [Nitrospiraceae bacterium]
MARNRRTTPIDLTGRSTDSPASQRPRGQPPQDHGPIRIDLARRPPPHTGASSRTPRATAARGPTDGGFRRAGHPERSHRSPRRDVREKPVARTHRDRDRFVGGIIDDRQAPDGAPIGGAVEHEVHRPHLVGRIRPHPRLGLARQHLLALAPPHLQLRFLIQPLHALVVHAHPFLPELRWIIPTP